MKKKLNILIFTLLIFTFSIFIAIGKCHAHLYRLADKSTPTFEEMINDLKKAQIIFIGESHDNPAHHRAQLQIIKALENSGTKVAIGLEMFRSDSQKYLEQWVNGKMSLHQFMNIFNDNWSDFNQYREIFNHSYFKKIPMIGLNLSRSITRQVARNGFKSLSKKQLNELPIVTCNIDPAYEKFIKRALGGHANEDVKFQYFCEAQLLWDNVMAENLIAFLDKNPDYSVVVIAGSGHAWKHGIPARIKDRSEYAFRVILPEVIGRSEKGLVTEADTDYLLLGVDIAPLH